MLHSKIYNPRGVSMLEIIIVIGIFSILSLGASTLVMESIKSNDIIWEQLFTQSEGRKVLKNITDEVRRAEESSIGSYPIALAGEYEFTFYANVDEDSYREKVHYWLEGTTFNYGITKPSGNPLSYLGTEMVTEVAHSVLNQQQSQPIFYYFDESYTGSSTSTPLSQPLEVADIHMVKIQLELERDPTKSPVPLHVETIVQIRNLKTN